MEGRINYRHDSGDDESDGCSGAGVELSLRLRMGSSPPPPPPPAAARRGMAIFYDGRVCAVDVTEIQAKEIISMANREILAADQRQQHREDDDGHVQDRGSSNSNATERCGGHVVRSTPATGGCPRQQGLAATMAAAPGMTTDQAGLSMKRSLQRFLQKREARRQPQATRH